MRTGHTALLAVLLAGTIGMGVACGGGADTGQAAPTAETDTLTSAVPAQTTCPVMGGAINREYYADYKGKRVYFCCPGCKEKFAADPGMYIEKLEEQGVDIEDVPVESEARLLTPQTNCPVMGGEIDRTQYADHNGKRVYFCCPGCSGTFAADPEKYIEKLQKQGVDIEDVPVEQG